MNRDDRLLRLSIHRLLRARRQPPTILGLLFTSPGLPLLAIVGVACVGLLLALDLPRWVPAGMAGVFAGAALRDFGLARRTVRLWPMHRELYDWQKVDALAEQSGLAQGKA